MCSPIGKVAKSEGRNCGGGGLKGCRGGDVAWLGSSDDGRVGILWFHCLTASPSLLGEVLNPPLHPLPRLSGCSSIQNKHSLVRISLVKKEKNLSPKVLRDVLSLCKLFTIIKTFANQSSSLCPCCLPACRFFVPNCLQACRPLSPYLYASLKFLSLSTSQPFFLFYCLQACLPFFCHICLPAGRLVFNFLFVKMSLFFYPYLQYLLIYRIFCAPI